MHISDTGQISSFVMILLCACNHEQVICSQKRQVIRIPRAWTTPHVHILHGLKLDYFFITRQRCHLNRYAGDMHLYRRMRLGAYVSMYLYVYVNMPEWRNDLYVSMIYMYEWFACITVYVCMFVCLYIYMYDIWHACMRYVHICMCEYVCTKHNCIASKRVINIA